MINGAGQAIPNFYLAVLGDFNDLARKKLGAKKTWRSGAFAFFIAGPARAEPLRADRIIVALDRMTKHFVLYFRISP